jgi:hypothetical protein
VRVPQYGVTRDRLRDVLADDEGWDAIHISGHGSPGQLLLETEAGRPDRVSAAQLADLLDLARRRLKLVTISACWSAALAVAEQRRLLGLPVQDDTSPERTGRPRDAGPAPGSLATELARRLDCAVLAMRYPVADEFAIALGGKLYELLADGGQPLPEAVGMTLRALASGSDGTGPGGTVFPALSVATPALFGGRAIGLRLVEVGGQAWRKLGGLPEGFFATGETTMSGEDYLDVLAAWTEVVTETLTSGEQDLFWFLCCLEERDRERATLDGNWTGLWTALGRAGQPPGLGEALSVLAARGLAGIQAVRDDEDESWAVHPGVAAAGRAQAGKPFQRAVDAEVSRYWASVFSRASGGKDEVTDTGLLARAGLAEVPYLMRQEQWTAAAGKLERAFNRDPSRSNASAVLPAIQQIIGVRSWC